LTAESLAETSSGESAERAGQIVTSGHAAAEMLADFVDFTSSRLGRAIPLTKTRVDLAQLSQQVMAESKACFPRAQVEFTTQGDTVGQWDPHRLRQVVSNLLRNAVEHGQDTPIHLAIIGDGAAVRLRVRNGGEPVPSELLPRIFEPMVHRCAEQRKPRPAGSLGLGLYIAREIAHAHGGAIKVESSAAHGTEFTVELPRQPQAKSGPEHGPDLPDEARV
jgi:sigma-B regulation protein RsbU (phosphoserine phosphatase)